MDDLTVNDQGVWPFGEFAFQFPVAGGERIRSTSLKGWSYVVHRSQNSKGTVGKCRASFYGIGSSWNERSTVRAVPSASKLVESRPNTFFWAFIGFRLWWTTLVPGTNNNLFNCSHMELLGSTLARFHNIRYIDGTASVVHNHIKIWL